MATSSLCCSEMSVHESCDCSTQTCCSRQQRWKYDMLCTLHTTFMNSPYEVIAVFIKPETTVLYTLDKRALEVIQSLELKSNELRTDLVESCIKYYEKYDSFLLRKTDGHFEMTAMKSDTTLQKLEQWLSKEPIQEINNNCLLALRESDVSSKVTPDLDECNYVYNTGQTKVWHHHHQKHGRNHWVSACPNAIFRKEQVVQRLKRKVEDQRNSVPLLETEKLSVQETTHYGDKDVQNLKSKCGKSCIPKRVKTEECPEAASCTPIEHSKHKHTDFKARSSYSRRRYSDSNDEMESKENHGEQRRRVRQRKISCLGKVKWKGMKPLKDNTNSLSARVRSPFTKLYDNGNDDRKKSVLKQRLRDVTNFPLDEALPQTTVQVYPAKKSKSKSGNRRNRGTGRPDVSEATGDSQALDSSSDTDSRPVMVSDLSEESLRRPPRELILTSSRSVFGSITDSSLPIPALGTAAQEQSLIARLRGEASSNTGDSGQSGVPPRHPEYSSQSARRQTFGNWPSTTGQDGSRMAVYGFFYTGQQDLIRCFQCGIGLKDWSHSDEPLFEHVRHSGQCPFLRELLGNDLLNAYKQNLGMSVSGPEAPSPTGGPRMRNPDYESHDSRLASYSNWPSSARQRPQTLAEAGLFYTGFNDLVRCFHCDGGLQRWEDGDVPWVEHARWFPQCNFVKRVKGQAFINMVRRAAEEVQREEEDPPVFSNKVRERLEGQPTGEDARTLTGAFHNMILSIEDFDPAARGALELGFSRVAVRQAIDEFNRIADRHGLAHTTEDLVNILTARIDAGEVLPTDEPPRVTDPNEENRRLKGIIKCMICEVNDINMLFLPCTHHKLCENCAEGRTHCPVCDKRIEDKIKTFMS
ncbi:Baculoviral IAP repeat-containing protein 2 [Mactra antiquata]